jgi:hypothetical protein
MECYNFFKIKNKEGIYDKSMDATYIITMENNKLRKENIKKQLKKCIFTKTLYIVYNKGFRKCEKNLIKKKSTYDLIHCNLEIFKHSLREKYNNVLILEDDFIIQDRILEPKNIININSFCTINKEKIFGLSLGSIPLMLFPYKSYFYKNYLSIGTQSMVYSKKYRIYLLKNTNKIYKSEDWDDFINFKLDSYIYYKPLITQTFPETENQKNWPSYYGFTKLGLYINKKIELDKKSQPAYDNIYIITKVINFILFILFIFIIFMIIKSVKKKLN